MKPSVAVPRWLLFEHERGAYDVDVEGRECSCKEPSCTHLAVVKDLVDRGARDFKWTVKKAFHRAIRRRDPITALRWARWYELLYGEHAIKRYCAEILLEETRNVRLHLAWQKMRDRSVTEMVTALVCSHKTWELPSRQKNEAFKHFLEAFAESSTDPITPAQIRKNIARDHHPKTLLWTMWRVYRSQDRFSLEEDLKTALRDRAEKAGGLVHEVASSKWFNKAWMPVAIIEMLTGAWDQTANEAVCKPDALLDPAPVVPRAEGLDDPRWDDKFLSMLWRELAVRKFGPTYKNQSWDAVLMDENQKHWAEQAVDVDRWNHPRVVVSKPTRSLNKVIY